VVQKDCFSGNERVFSHVFLVNDLI